jgi:uncharacterized protein YqgC (DUF456 family)
MDYIFLILGLVFLIIGVIGSLLPGLPGPPFSWGGLAFVYACSFVPVNYYILTISFILMVVITIMDFIIPSKGAKRFGGSKYGIWGTNIGLVLGLITPIPLGVIIGPFLGALVGELIFDKNDTKRALKAASGAFLGFLLSTFGKVMFGMILLIQSIYLFITYFFI